MQGTEHPTTENLRSLETPRLPSLSFDCCIYKVPKRLRNINEKAYTPQVVSIGPIHHANEALKAMHEQKVKYANHFIQITNVNVHDYIRIIVVNEDRIRGCYADSFVCPTDSLWVIFLLDAMFIIEILLRFYCKEFDDDQNDRIYYKPWMIQDIVPDLQLLENQIPFFIVEEIYEFAKVVGSLPRSLMEVSINEICYKFFKYNVGFVEADEQKMMKSVKFLHFVDLGRIFYLQDEELPLPMPMPMPMQMQQQQVIVETTSSSRTEILSQVVFGRLNQAGDRPVSVRRFSLTANGEDEKERLSLTKLNVPTITKLHRAGVKLKVGSPKNQFKIKFHNGILEIPKLFINDHTQIFLRNIIAFEQCHCIKFTITNYFVILKRLVSTIQDLELLFEYGIVDYSLGDIGRVFSLITKLSDEVTVDYSDSDFVHPCKDMDDYCNVRWHRWKASLKQIYFDTPWTTISVIAASVVIILTFIQTVCSILSLK